MTLRSRFHDSLAHLSDAELDTLTAESSVFLGRRWLRMLDAVDLSPLVRGKVSLQYAIAYDGDTPLALCPFFVTSGGDIHPHYSFKKFFFTGWRADLERLSPNSRGWSALAAGAASVYYSLARHSGVAMDRAVIVASPLSLRGGIACAPGAAELQLRTRCTIIEGLRQLALEECCPLYFYGVEEQDTALRDALTAGAFQQLFLFHDNYIDVPGQRFDDYLGQFKSDARRRLRKEMGIAQTAGVRIERVSRLADMGALFERFYEVTYSKYGKTHFCHPPWFWAALEQHVSPLVEALVAFKGSEPIGFSLLLRDLKDLWFYRVGRAVAEPMEALYFNLAFYEPMRRAYALGARRLWLGPGGYETKRLRGARRRPVYGYTWLPRLWSRSVLRPYLSVFSRLNHAQTGGHTTNRRLPVQAEPPRVNPEP